VSELTKPSLIEQGFIVNETLPTGYAGFQLAGGGVLHASGPAGDLLVQQLIYPLFSIRYKVIQITEPMRVVCDMSKGMLIALLGLKNTIKCTMEGIGTCLLRPGEFLLLHAGQELMTTQIEEAEDNQVIEIDYSPELLTSFSSYFPVLHDWSRDTSRLPHLVTKNVRPAGPRAIEVAHDLLHAPVDSPVQSLYFELKVREYLLLLLSASSQPKEDRPDLSPEQWTRLADIADRLRTQTGKKFPIQQLAREMGMNEMKLKTVFKAIYGKGIHSYQLDARMHVAHKLLEEGDLTTKAIAAKVGYELTTSFITKFREYFGYPPSQVSRR